MGPPHSGRTTPPAYWGGHPRRGAAPPGVSLHRAPLEVAQGLLTVTRQADVFDLVADGGGVAFALTLAYLGIGGWAGRLERWLGAGP